MTIPPETIAAGHWHLRRVNGEMTRADCTNPACPMTRTGCAHGPDRRCFECATDEEAAAAIPAFGDPS